MKGTMKASELNSPRASRIITCPIPEVGPKDVLIKVRICGVCASEYHNWNGGAYRYPMYLGHEASGEVVEVGECVKDIQKGERVTGLFLGAYAEYAVTDMKKVVKIPDTVSYTEALGEPISCVISGALRVNVDYGKTVAIIGAGFMGLMVLQLMKAKGAYKIIAIDPRQDMLDMALAYGADEAYTPDDIPDKYKLYEYYGLTGIDIVIECTGNEKALNLAIEMLKCHAILSVVGFHQGEHRKVNMEMLNWKAGDLINAHERRLDVQMQSMAIGMKMLEKKQLDLKALVTNRYTLEEVDKAFIDFEKKEKGYIKSVIEV